MFQLQAEHRHAAGLIDLLFKGRNLLLQLLCHTSIHYYISACIILCSCYMYKRLNDYYNPYAL